MKYFLRVASDVFALVAAAILLAFTCRRIMFTVAALFARPRVGPEQTVAGSGVDWPDVLIVAPCRDEEDLVPGLCEALGRLDYPARRHRVVLVDDGSCDRTRSVMEECARGRRGWRVISLPRNGGKPAALNSALRTCAFGDIVYVFDADHRPAPNVLRLAARYFDDPNIAGVSGRTVPLNPLSGPSAYYSALENYVHQMITMRAKDRLDLAPAILGSNCGYRRVALSECGGFREGALLEDSDLTLAFYRRGYRVRFMEEAVAYHQVPETVGGYLRQHERWARGFDDVAKNHASAILRNASLSLFLRAELLFFAAGYLDRLAVVGMVALATSSFVRRRRLSFQLIVLCAALLTPLAEVIALFIEQRVSLAMWKGLPLMPIFFFLDIFAAGQGSLKALLRCPPTWPKTQRRATPTNGSTARSEHEVLDCQPRDARTFEANG